MSRTTWFRSMGIALFAVVFLSMGTRPSIRAGQPSAPLGAAVVGGALDPGGGGSGPLTTSPVVHLVAKPMSAEAAKVWLKLQEKVPMEFAADSPLDDVLKFIQSNTVNKANLPEGIPVYLDPTAVEKPKGAGPMVSINLKGIPLATTLKLVLDQVGLVYRVHEAGFLLITAKDSEEAPPDAEALILDNLSALREEVRQLRAELNASRQEPDRSGHAIPQAPASATPGGMGTKGGML